MGQKIPDVFSTHSAAKFCRVTPMTIIRWIDEGRIRAYKTPGGHRRIMRADLEAFCRRAQIPMQWEDRVDTGTRRVLIIDDDPTVVDAILDAIFDDETAQQSDAYEVEHADNAFDGGRMFLQIRPHIVFLDLGLPGLDATQVTQAMHDQPGGERARVIGIADDDAPAAEGLDAVLGRPLAKKAVRRATGPLPKLPPS